MYSKGKNSWMKHLDFILLDIICLELSLFLAHQIKFLEIPEIIQAAMEQHQVKTNPDVEQILAAEAETYDYIKAHFE